MAERELSPLEKWDIAIADAQRAATANFERAEALRTHPVKSGDVFILTAGEYSDYRIIDLFRALTDFDLVALRREGGDLAAELVKRSLAEPIDHQDINLYDL